VQCVRDRESFFSPFNLAIVLFLRSFADRGLYVGDSDFVTVPIEGMLDKDYLATRAELIGDEDIDGPASPGEIDGFDPSAPADGTTKNMGTSHISIADKYGNVLSMTTTVESFFGNGVMVPDWGFLLNNQITDFSFDPGTPEQPVANRVQANKRPRSSMSPTIVLDKYGMPFLATGSPGGSRIIGYVLNTITAIIDFGLDPQEAINNPHYLNRNGDTELESLKPGIVLDYDIEGLTMALEARGHSVSIIGGETSGLSLIQMVDGVFIGGGDKRRDGTVGGSDYDKDDTPVYKGKGGMMTMYKGGGMTAKAAKSSKTSGTSKGKGGEMGEYYKGSSMMSSKASSKGKGGDMSEKAMMKKMKMMKKYSSKS
jgi:gamma-glutamyltranspeptidase